MTDLADLPRVCVEWLDANASTEGWIVREDLSLDVTPCETYGVLLEITETQVKIAGTVGLDPAPDSQHVHHVFAIPRGMVQRVRVVSVGDDLKL